MTAVVIGLSLAVAAGTDTVFAGQKNKHRNNPLGLPSSDIGHSGKALKGNINADFSPHAKPHKNKSKHDKIRDEVEASRHRQSKKAWGHEALRQENLQRGETLIEMIGVMGGIAGGGSHQ
jgi:hypothetical protein